MTNSSPLVTTCFSSSPDPASATSATVTCDGAARNNGLSMMKRATISHSRSPPRIDSNAQPYLVQRSWAPSGTAALEAVMGVLDFEVSDFMLVPPEAPATLARKNSRREQAG